MSSAGVLKSRYEQALEKALNAAPGTSISDTLAAYLLALDLMAGDERAQKAGYSPANALLAAKEVFGDAVGPRVAEMLGTAFSVPGKTFTEGIAGLLSADPVDATSGRHPEAPRS